MNIFLSLPSYFNFFLVYLIQKREEQLNLVYFLLLFFEKLKFLELVGEGKDAWEKAVIGDGVLEKVCDVVTNIIEKEVNYWEIL